MELEQIFGKLEDIDQKIDALLIWQAEHNKEHETVSRDLSEVRNTLFENPGLVIEVQRLSNRNAFYKPWSDFWVHVLGIVIASGVLILIGWLLFVYKKIS